ncbi:hypothetical protein [Paraburkholderia caribensis]|uniref:hypothetical protein n=1 Tax=Paraburkholderia caribensis TaxID=75105 RepID=UPI001CC5CC19|nr:hypothetical protein [Paraburkholderia caribensis]
MSTAFGARRAGRSDSRMVHARASCAPRVTRINGIAMEFVFTLLVVCAIGAALLADWWRAKVEKRADDVKAEAHARTDLLITTAALLLRTHPQRDEVIAAVKELSGVQERRWDDPQYSAALNATLRRLAEESGAAQPRDSN